MACQWAFSPHRIGRKLSAVTCCILLASGLAWLIWAESLWSLYVVACAFGVGFGGMLTSMTALVGDTFGLANIGKLLGCLDISFGVAAFAGPLLAGFIYDASGEYSLAFAGAAIAAAVAAVSVTQIGRETDRLAVEA